MGRFDGQVVFITGAGRGQGRSHAVKFALEGADIIAVDVCEQIPTVDYPLASPEDLAETIAQVESLDRRIVAREADVRDLAILQDVITAGVGELGRLDIVLANAAVAPLSPHVTDPVATFRDVIDVNLTGVWNTVQAALPVLIEQGTGASIVLTSSTAGLTGHGGASAGGQAYTAAKHALVGLMRNFALNYAQHGIRVNTVHPTGVATPMVLNETLQRILTETPELIGGTTNLLPVDMLEPADITNAIMFLCSAEARYITGVALPVDAGMTIK
jgi:SDR family mycofactocin-dependent oxidoreductase